MKSFSRSWICWLSCCCLCVTMLWVTAATHAQDLPDVPSGNGGRRPKRPGSNVKATSSQLAVPLDAELILSDDFAEMTSGWPIGESPTAVWGYNRGSYMISLRGTGRVRSENDNVVEQGIMVPKAVFRDFCLDFRATLQAQAFSYMEVRFRTSHKGFYTLAFNTKKMFSLTRFDGQYRTLLPFRKSESLQDVNDFRILVEGGRILIYANGTPIAACKDSAPLPSGGLVFLSGLASGNKLVESKLLIQKVRLYVLPLVQGEPRTEPPLITSNTPLPKQTTAPDVNSESSEGVAESPYAPPSRQNNHSAAEGQLPTSTLGETPPPAPAPATAPTPAPPSGPTIDTTPPPEVMSPQGTPTVPANPGAAATAPTIQTIPSTQDLASTAMRVDPNASGSTLPGVTSPNSAPPEPAPIPDDRARDPGTKPKAQKPAALNNIPVPGAETFPLKAGNYWIYEGIVRYDPPEGSTPLTNPNPATTGDEPAPAATAPQPGKPIEKTIQHRMEVLDTAVVDGWGFALVKGYPSELAGYSEGHERRDSLIVRDPAGRYYLVQRDDIAAQLVDLQGGSMDRFEKPIPDDLILAPPLNQGAQFGNPEVLQREGTTNRWVVTGEGSTKVAHVQGLAGTAAQTARPMFTVEFRTNPDVTTVDFVPGIGILGYKYKHMGSSAECDVRLIGCRLKP